MQLFSLIADCFRQSLSIRSMTNGAIMEDDELAAVYAKSSEGFLTS